MHKEVLFIALSLAVAALVAAPTANEDYVDRQDAATLRAAEAYTDAAIIAATGGVTTVESDPIFVAARPYLCTIEAAQKMTNGIPVVTEATVTGWGFLKSFTEADPTFAAWLATRPLAAYALSADVYTKEQVDRLVAGATPTDYEVFKEKAQAGAIHAVSKDNPHDVTAYQVGAYTTNEVDGQLANIRSSYLPTDGGTIDGDLTVTGNAIFEYDAKFDTNVEVGENSFWIGDRVIDDILSEKANYSGVYRKGEVDEMLRGKADNSALAPIRVDIGRLYNEKADEFWFFDEWTNTYTYAVGDVVRATGGIYVAREANTNKKPGISPAIWKKVFTLSGAISEKLDKSATNNLHVVESDPVAMPRVTALETEVASHVENLTATKMDKATSAASGYLAVFDSNGNAVKSGLNTIGDNIETTGWIDAHGGFLINGYTLAAVGDDGIMLYTRDNEAIMLPKTGGTMALTSDIPAPYVPSATNEMFAAAVLAVAVSTLSTNITEEVYIAATNACANLGIDPSLIPGAGTTGTVGGFIAILFVVVFWMRKKIFDNSGNVSDQFATDLVSKPGAISAMRYGLASTSATVKAADRTVTKVTLGATAVTVTFPDADTGKTRDFLLRIDADNLGTGGSLNITKPTGATIYGDAFPSPEATKQYLVAITETAANEFYVRTIEITIPTEG